MNDIYYIKDLLFKSERGLVKVRLNDYNKNLLFKRRVGVRGGAGVSAYVHANNMIFIDCQ
ncbi:hypothetical protein OUHCRE7_29340 [Enterobacter hormaechei subsp. hoffmannii]